MNLWAYLDKRTERRAERTRLLVKEGLDFRSLLRSSVRETDPRFIIAAIIIGLFAWAFERSEGEQQSLMTGALIAAFAGAWGFYLGSSSGAKQADQRADLALDTAKRAVEKMPGSDEADAELEPGETARAVPRKP